MPPQSITAVKARIDAKLEPSDSHSFLSRFERDVVRNSVVIPSITYDTKQKDYVIVCENPTWRSYTISKDFILGDVSSHEGENRDSESFPLIDIIYEIERKRELTKTGASSPLDEAEANIASTEVDPNTSSTSPHHQPMHPHPQVRRMNLKSKRMILGQPQSPNYLFRHCTASTNLTQTPCIGCIKMV